MIRDGDDRLCGIQCMSNLSKSEVMFIGSDVRLAHINHGICTDLLSEADGYRTCWEHKLA